jgi:AcrR family transcriptional regulator
MSSRGRGGASRRGGRTRDARVSGATRRAVSAPSVERVSERDGAGVTEIQRARITAAMSELVREHGAGGVTVAHVVARSGVSRRTFYELFDDREDCFLAAFDRAIAEAGERVLPAYRAGGEWRERIAAGLEAGLRFLDAEPDAAYLCVVGALGAGPRALARRGQVVQALVPVVHEGCKETKATRRPGRLVAEGLVGAVLAIVHTRLLEERPALLLGLLNPLMATIVLPYLGSAAAERELGRAAPRRRRAVERRGDPLRELDMRLTYRTVRALLAIASHPGSSNRQIATAAGIADQGQISKLLSRLHALGLVVNSGGDHSKGEPNAWALTPTGQDVTRTLQAQAG